MTPAERKQRFNALSELGCIVCRNEHSVVTPACIHHLTGLKYRGTGRKANDEHTIPLCHTHHQGSQGIHSIGMRKWEDMFGTQESLLASVNELISRSS